MKRVLTILLIITGFNTTAQNEISRVWVSDNGEGTYKNPVIHADYSDPDVIRVGDDFYMISSSFNHVPALPILHSKDLVNWKIIGHALNRLVPEEYYQTVRHGGGVWAPSLRFHKGEFYIYYPDPDFGIYMIKSTSMQGPWSDPVLVEAGKGLIDPCPLWDDDGMVYLVHAYAGSRAGIKSILVMKQMNSTGTKTLGNGVIVYDGHGMDPTVEGPKIYKRNNYYYIFAPAGGVSTGWQLVLRSKNIYGPYERRVVLEQGSTSINGPHQGAWISTAAGEDWFMHFQDKGAYGRVVHLQPMKWIQDWPVIGMDEDGDGKGEPVSVYRKPAIGKEYPAMTVADSDNFDSTRLGLQWQWQATPTMQHLFPTSNGTLRFFTSYLPDSIKNLWSLASILGQKLPAEEFIATVRISFNPRHIQERFGMIMLGEDYAYISIQKESAGLFIVCKEYIKGVESNQEKELFHYPLKGNQLSMRVIVGKGGVYQLAFAGTEQQFQVIPKKFILKPGKWVGAKIGFFCLRENITNDAGSADLEWFKLDVNNNK